MRFVIVQNSLKTVFKFRLSYIEKLVKLGTVIVIAPNDDDYSFDELKKYGVIILPVSPMSSFLLKLKAIAQMNYFVIRERCKGGIVICHFLVTFLMCYLSLVPFNRKLVIYIEGLGSVFTKSKVLRKILRFFLLNNHAKRLFCNQSERKLIGNEKDTITYGIGINVNKFKSSEINRVKKDNYTLLYVGRLVKDKGICDAINVFRQIRHNKKNVRMLIAGDIYNNNPTSISESDINEFKLEFGNDINFLGYLHDIFDVYEQADVLLIPSIREGFPVCVMEASSMGIPSVGYKVPGVEDAINNNVNGIIVDFKSNEQLFTKTYHLLDNEELKAYRKKCRKYAVENFDAEIKSNEIVCLLLSLAQGNCFEKNK